MENGFQKSKKEVTTRLEGQCYSRWEERRWRLFLSKGKKAQHTQKERRHSILKFWYRISFALKSLRENTYSPGEVKKLTGYFSSHVIKYIHNSDISGLSYSLEELVLLLLYDVVSINMLFMQGTLNLLYLFNSVSNSHKNFFLNIPRAMYSNWCMPWKAFEFCVLVIFYKRM